MLTWSWDAPYVNREKGREAARKGSTGKGGKRQGVMLMAPTEPTKVKKGVTRIILRYDLFIILFYQECRLIPTKIRIELTILFIQVKS